ncbi:MAG: hypothetical protein LVR00_01025 [Rhabdochlamydiaceae bacterium]|jgi:hypothetical protein
MEAVADSRPVCLRKSPCPGEERGKTYEVGVAHFAGRGSPPLMYNSKNWEVKHNGPHPTSRCLKKLPKELVARINQLFPRDDRVLLALRKEENPALLLDIIESLISGDCTPDQKILIALGVIGIGDEGRWYIHSLIYKLEQLNCCISPRFFCCLMEDLKKDPAMCCATIVKMLENVNPENSLYDLYNKLKIEMMGCIGIVIAKLEQPYHPLFLSSMKIDERKRLLSLMDRVPKDQQEAFCVQLNRIITPYLSPTNVLEMVEAFTSMLPEKIKQAVDELIGFCKEDFSAEDKMTVFRAIVQLDTSRIPVCVGSISSFIGELKKHGLCTSNRFLALLLNNFLNDPEICALVCARVLQSVNSSTPSLYDLYLKKNKEVRASMVRIVIEEEDDS